jgi:heterodisulfide reductase subunit C
MPKKTETACDCLNCDYCDEAHPKGRRYSQFNPKNHFREASPEQMEQIENQYERYLERCLGDY